MSIKKWSLEPTDPAVLRRWGMPLALSLVILLTGIAWTMVIGREANELHHRLSHLDEHVSDLRAYVSLKEPLRQ